MYHGNAPLQEMSGQWQVGRLKKSPTDVSDFFSLFWSMANKLNKHELERWAVVV